jgi:hypothetical protein
MSFSVEADRREGSNAFSVSWRGVRSGGVVWWYAPFLGESTDIMLNGCFCLPFPVLTIFYNVVDNCLFNAVQIKVKEF